MTGASGAVGAGTGRAGGAMVNGTGGLVRAGTARAGGAVGAGTGHAGGAVGTGTGGSGMTISCFCDQYRHKKMLKICIKLLGFPLPKPISNSVLLNND